MSLPATEWPPLFFRSVKAPELCQVRKSRYFIKLGILADAYLGILTVLEPHIKTYNEIALSISPHTWGKLLRGISASPHFFGKVSTLSIHSTYGLHVGWAEL